MQRQLGPVGRSRTLRSTGGAGMMRRALGCSLAALLGTTALPALAADVASPDGRTVVTLDVDGDGVPFYRVTRDGEALIAESDLGFIFTDAEPMRRNFQVETETRASHDDTWEQPWGERRFVRDHHNELSVTFREARETSTGNLCGTMFSGCRIDVRHNSNPVR